VAPLASSWPKALWLLAAIPEVLGHGIITSDQLNLAYS
jgi:hypothetical protein